MRLRGPPTYQRTKSVSWYQLLIDNAMQAIETIGWGLLDKVYYIFEKAFWSDKSYFIVRVSPAIGEWTLWVNMQQVRHNSFPPACA